MAKTKVKTSIGELVRVLRQGAKLAKDNAGHRVDGDGGTRPAAPASGRRRRAKIRSDKKQELQAREERKWQCARQHQIVRITSTSARCRGRHVRARVPNWQRTTWRRLFAV